MNVFPDSKKNQSQKKAMWLFSIAAFSFFMIVFGGLVRLTESGLSIVEWNVVMGAIPPLTHDDWNIAFTKYQSSPEFKLKNFSMTIEPFKFIFYMEYFHRLIGRLIGFVFLLPFVYFVITKKCRRNEIISYIVLFILGGLQGAMGWYMVKSGLIHEPHVSHFRLTAHLLLALMIVSFSLWLGLRQWYQEKKIITNILPSKIPLMISMILLTAQIITGGFVAGTDAGLVSDTFPKMHGQWIPDTLLIFDPPIRNFFENLVMLQFIHRVGAMIVFCVLLYTSRYVFQKSVSKDVKIASFMMAALVLFQFVLGIATIIFHVPILLASLHQALAVLLWCSLIFLLFRSQAMTHSVTAVSANNKVEALAS